MTLYECRREMREQQYLCPDMREHYVTCCGSGARVGRDLGVG